MPSIVQINVSQSVGPVPDRLQSTGAFISQGATTTPSGTSTILTTLADLTPILAGALALTSLTWSGSVVTATTTAPHGIPNGQIIPVTISGATPTGYNGTFQATSTGASTFTYPLVSDPGSETIPGVWTPEDVAELVAMTTTFFAQGSGQSVYVLELGEGSAAAGVTALSAWITANPGIYYSYLVPRYWAAESTYRTFLASFEALTAKTYFFTTMTTGNYSSFTALMKCVVGLIEAPGIPVTEFSLAAAFWVTLHYDPGATNKVTPLAFAFVFGVTAYPTRGNGTLLTALKTAGVNYIGSGAEGGISDTVFLWGTTMDVRPFNYWYSADWIQIETDLFISNAVINGSNTPLNPLYLNQDGIDRLQAVGAQVLANSITFGLALGTVTQTSLDGPAFSAALSNGQFATQEVINAVPFVDYYREHPGDYRIGKYAGFSIQYIPLRGFDSIVFNINVTDFVSQ